MSHVLPDTPPDQFSYSTVNVRVSVYDTHICKYKTSIYFTLDDSLCPHARLCHYTHSWHTYTHTANVGDRVHIYPPIVLCNVIDERWSGKGCSSCYDMPHVSAIRGRFIHLSLQNYNYNLISSKCILFLLLTSRGHTKPKPKLMSWNYLIQDTHNELFLNEPQLHLKPSEWSINRKIMYMSMYCSSYHNYI